MKLSSIISSKGQVVIPAKLRKRYGLREGAIVVFQEDRGRLVLEPGNHAVIYALQGSLAGFPLEQDLAEERRAEQKRGQLLTALAPSWGIGVLLPNISIPLSSPR